MRNRKTITTNRPAGGRHPHHGYESAYASASGRGGIPPQPMLTVPRAGRTSRAAASLRNQRMGAM